MRSFIVPLIAIPLILSGLSAFGQNSQSADQIINSLKPSGNLVQGGTRGIRLAAPPSGATASPVTPAATGQPHAAPRAGKPQAVTPPSANLTVNFASGSADLTPQATQQLNELGRALSSSALSGYKFRIEGHTDTVGTAESNRMLSDRRAQAVVSYITSQFGVDAARLEAVGKGEDDLAIPTAAQTPEPRNRRVQVINVVS